MRARSRGAAQARHHSLALTSLALLALSPLLIHARALAGTQVWTGTAPRAKSVEAIARDPLNPALPFELGAAARRAGSRLSSFCAERDSHLGSHGVLPGIENLFEIDVPVRTQ